MTHPSADLRKQLSSFGTITFEAAGHVGGAPALVVMDVDVVAVARAGAPCAYAPFVETEAHRDQDATRVRLRVGAAELEIDFDDEATAARLVRVLGVRQDQARLDSGEVQYTTRFVSAASSDPRGPQSEYEESARQTLFVGTLLIALAGVDLAAGVGVALVLTLSGNPLAGLVWLAAAATGCLVPLGLGQLCRTVVLRHRELDARSA